MTLDLRAKHAAHPTRDFALPPRLRAILET
jgi:hypothetical protein